MQNQISLNNSCISRSKSFKLLKSQKFMIKAALIVSWGGFVYGYDIGIISGTLSEIEQKFNLNEYETGLVVALLPLGSIFGCIIGGPTCDFIGRWKTIILLNVIYIFGTLTIAMGPSIYYIYFGRYIIGVATALSGIADIPYLTEISSPHYRGRLCSTYELMAMLGILFAFLITLLVTLYMKKDNFDYYQVLYTLPAIFALIQMFAMIFLPESPKWLISKNKMEEAKHALFFQVDGDSDELEARFADMCVHVLNERVSSNDDDCKESNTSTDNMASNSRGSSNCNKSNNVISNHGANDKHPALLSSFHSSASHVMPTKSSGDLNVFRLTMLQYRLPLFCAISLAVFQQFTGGVLVRNYAPRIFLNAGFGIEASQIFTVLLGIVKVFCCASSMYYVDHSGRKPLLLIGISINAVGMFILTLLFMFHFSKSIVVFAIGCAMILGGYSIGFGPVLWLMQSEMFPTSIRARAVGISIIARNVSEFIVNFSFLPLISLVGNAGAFLFYFFMCTFAFIYVYIFVVETAGIEPDEILKSFEKNMLRLRRKTKGAFMSLPSTDLSSTHMSAIDNKDDELL